MGAVIVLAPGDQVGLLEVPLHNPLLHVLLGKRERQSAAGSMAEVDPAGAIDLDRARVRVLVLLLVLQKDSETLLLELLGQSATGRLLGGFQLVERDEALLMQELDERGQKRQRLQGLAGVGVEPAVDVQDAPHNLPAEIVGTLGDVRAVFHMRSEEHTSELQSPCNLVCRLLLEKKKNTDQRDHHT